MADRGSRGALRAIELANAPGRFLSTVQIGITLIGVLAGAFSGATLADRLGGLLASYGISEEVADELAFVLVVVVITYLSLIVGELVPKQIALRSPERMASAVAAPMAVLAKICTPLVWLLELSSSVVLRLLRFRQDASRRVTDEEIRSLIAEAEASGVVEAGERQLIAGVMRLADRGVRAIMTPRPDVEWIDVNDGDDAILSAIRKSPRSRLLVCEGNPDNVVGVLRGRDLAMDRLEGRTTPVRALLRVPVTLPDTLGALSALERLHDAGNGFGLVVDEYGHIEGVVTPADALAAMRGAAATASADEEPMVVRRGDGSLLVSGGLPVDGLEEVLGQAVPRTPPYNTVAGLLLHHIRRVPDTGETVDIAGWRFEVVDMDGRRIDKVLVSRAVTDGARSV
jgi:putative hemolysin